MNLILVLAAHSLLAQAPNGQGAPGAQPEITKTLKVIAANAQRLLPMLDQTKPQEWVAKGAPDGYVSQWKSAEAQCKALAVEAQAVAQHPENLNDVLNVLFRLQFLEVTSSSLEEGLKKYQNPALAELLSATRAENTPNREKLQQYALDLADQREQDFRVADKEAQRCRGQLSREVQKSRR